MWSTNSRVNILKKPHFSPAIILLISLSLTFVSIEASAQSALSPKASTKIELSAADEEILIGMHKFKENAASLAKIGKGYSTWVRSDDNGKLREAPVTSEFKAQLRDDDTSSALAVIREYNLEFKYPVNDQKMILGVREEYTPDYLLFRAALVNHIEFARDLLNDYTIDTNIKFETGRRKVTALIAATAGQHAEIVELLLDAGADPNLKSSGGSHPLEIAVKNRDTTSTRALFEAGATLNAGFGPRGVANKTFKELVRDDKAEIVQLLLENGMELKPPPPVTNINARLFRNPTTPLSPLMVALAGGNKRMALALLPHSDPRFYTDIPLRRARSGVEDIKILPPANALFVARLRSADHDQNIEQLIENRIEEIDGKEAVAVSRIQAASAMSDLAYYEGDLERAKGILASVLGDLSVAEIIAAQDTEYANAVKSLMLKKHELAIVTGDTLSVEEQKLSGDITSAGDRFDHLHAMLEVINQAATGDYEPLFADWKAQYSGLETGRWDYSRLNSWIEAFADGPSRKRAYRALDYFEFSVSTSR